MKAIHYQNFGTSDVISLNDISKPEIKSPEEVLIQVKAASVNPLDMKIRKGFMQQMYPVHLPFIPGLDAAGIVVAVGEHVQSIKIGDEVVAVTMVNAYAEYVVVHQKYVSLKPKNLTFAEATSLAVNLGTAESTLFSEGKLKAGQKVFIQGAAGAVGATMVQLAKQIGLFVYATASGKGIEMVKALGADEVIDYKTTDLTKQTIKVDLVADCVGGPSQAFLFDLLEEGGKLLSIAGMPSQEIAQLKGIEARFISADLTSKNLKNGLTLVEEGKIKPIVSKQFSLSEAAKAQDYLEAGGVNGKVVLMIE